MLRSSLGTRPEIKCSANQYIPVTNLYTENCLDRHAEEDPHRAALIWEKDEPNQQKKVTYRYGVSTIKHINKFHFAIKPGKSCYKQLHHQYLNVWRHGTYILGK